MPSKPLPKPLSQKRLNQKYQFLALETKGRLDCTTETGKANLELLKKYYSAFSNLYGSLMLKEAWDLFKLAEKEITDKKQILKKDFFTFSEAARYESYGYYVLEIDELYEDEKRGNAGTRFIVNKKLYRKGYGRFSDYYRLAEEQMRRTLCALNKEEILPWAEPGNLWRSPEGRALKRFIESRAVHQSSDNIDINGAKIAGKRLTEFVFWHKDEKINYDYTKREWEKAELKEYYDVIESEKTLQTIEWQLNSPMLYDKVKMRIEYLLHDLDEVGVRLTKSQMDTFLKLYTDFANNSRTWPLCGWKPIELHMKYRGNETPTISFGAGLQKAFADGSINKEEVVEGMKKLGFQVID